MRQEVFRKRRHWKDHGDDGVLTAIIVIDDDDELTSQMDVPLTTNRGTNYYNKREIPQRNYADNHFKKIIITDVATTTEVADATTTTDATIADVVKKKNAAIQFDINSKINEVVLNNQEFTNTAHNEITNVSKAMVTNVEIFETAINTENNTHIEVSTLTEVDTAENIVRAEPEVSEITTNTEKMISKVVASEAPGTKNTATEMLAIIGISRLDLLKTKTAIVQEESTRTSIGVAVTTETVTLKNFATVTTAAGVKASVTDTSIMTDAIIIDKATNTNLPATDSTTDIGLLTDTITAFVAVNTEAHTAASTTDIAMLTDTFFGEIAINTKPVTKPDTDKAINTEAVSVKTATNTHKSDSFIDIALNTDAVSTETTTNTEEQLSLNVKPDYQKFESKTVGIDQVVEEIAAIAEAPTLNLTNRKAVVSIGVIAEPVIRNVITSTSKTIMINNAAAAIPTKRADKRTLTNNMKKLKQRSRKTSTSPSTSSLIKEVHFVDSSYVIYFSTIPHE